MTDRYANLSSDLLSPADHAAAVTPSDSDALPYASKRLWVGGEGDVALVTVGGDSVTYSSVPAGAYLYVRASQVMDTGTSATDIVAEY